MEASGRGLWRLVVDERKCHDDNWNKIATGESVTYLYDTMFQPIQLEKTALAQYEPTEQAVPVEQRDTTPNGQEGSHGKHIA